MFEEFAVLEAAIASLGFVITLKFFSGAMKFLSLALLSDAISNILYIFLLDEIVFTANALIMCILIILFNREVMRRRWLL